jgi:hypothetical protein
MLGFPVETRPPSGIKSPDGVAVLGPHGAAISGFGTLSISLTDATKVAR